MNFNWAEKIIVNNVQIKVRQMKRIVNHVGYEKRFEMLMYEAKGMVQCLNEVADDDKEYKVYVYDGKLEFGCYIDDDETGEDNWVKLA